MSVDSKTESVTVTREGEVAILTLQRPFSLDSAGKAALADAVTKLNAIQVPRTLILTASHPQAFLVDNR